MSFLVKNLTLKRFGKTIPLNQHSLIPDPPPISHRSASPNSSHRQETSRSEVNPDSPEVIPSHQNPEPTASSGVSVSSRTSSVERETYVERETSALKPSTNEEQSETEGQTLKKPGNLLPCPPCNSARTKFCYYNNYNVNQPRHFCKNCQRYWTAGGTMRSVPVGAGRRKNKNLSVSPYPQIILSMSAGHRNLETAYAPSEPVLKPQDYMLNCFTEPSRDDQSSTSSFTASNSLAKESKASNSHLQWRPQFQPPLCSYDPIPFWGCSLSSSWILPSSSESP